MIRSGVRAPPGANPSTATRLFRLGIQVAQVRQMTQNPTFTKLAERGKAFVGSIREAKENQIYPFFKPISRSFGPEVEVDGKRLIMVGSNDYLGFTHEPRVLEAAVEALRRWGTGPGGSRFLSGNMTLHEELEGRLAAFVGKKRAVVHTTGFLTNLGALSCLISNDDFVLFDKENHASIAEGCRAAGARVTFFNHNDAVSAERKLAVAREKNPDGIAFLITEGVFSMSGDVSALPDLVALKKRSKDVLIYLDDAHGLGVLGPNGRGAAMKFGLAADTDFIMGTFSKSMASIGGFIASDDDDVMTHLKHHSKTLIFSAALPAANAATVLACLDILENEPERVERLWRNTAKVREGYRSIGLVVRETESPIVPILVGDEYKACYISAELYHEGVFALPAVYPAVPKGRAIIRTAYQSTHEDRHIDRVLELLGKLAVKYRIRAEDFKADGFAFEE